ncbi:lactam utilization protein LamB [Rhodococcoides fascians]|uniref:5-oxoprolinase subunit PxpA n=1 Tax=Rhodococcoides fascians TaxID=1828 RepID=UPI000B9BE840|nr:5-oxoprolinase subunit PxpA [Rhodococcus fascians]OZE85347.1 lactam utilization protein LamB [Rhodococcus fascians]OZF11854.1 lactam utilization protein LamB [Rhodococcus fascians]OZF14623.1 lactam utilization protein LamB [Rhodococcus fascians]OZF61200.1 lactam utilization protein LamB [Rhodococcus fascians]OZF64304.1 lactam utilization protein LamB [Rhodococcus fascians]
MSSAITINSDLGESFGLHSFGHDDELLGLIHSANIACGFHAGDPYVMSATVTNAVAAGVALGAHPGLPDLTGFGRRQMSLTADEVRDLVIYQVGALEAFISLSGSRLNHIKPHGALFGMLSRDETLMTPVAELAARLGVQIYGLAGTAHQSAADAAGAQFVGELYVDLDYDSNGSLVIVRRPHATDPDAAAARVTSAMSTGTIAADDGSPLAVEFSSICVHSDTPNCVDVVKAVVSALENNRQTTYSEGQAIGNA